MTVNNTTLLRLAQPVTGTESGTWGEYVNLGVTDYLDASIAGTQTISTDANVELTLTTATSSSNALTSTSAQYAILNLTSARTAIRTVTLPTSSRSYIVHNNTTGGFAVTVGGVSVANGERCILTYDTSTSAYVKTVSSSAAALSGTLGVANGGTGAATLTTNSVLLGNGTSALQTVSPSTSGNLLLADGTTWGSTTVAGLGINKIINGKMEIFQRNTSFSIPALTNTTLTADRWLCANNSSSAALSVTESTEVPSFDYRRSLRIAVTTIDASIGSTETAFVRQAIEGYNARDLVGRTFTLSFWVKSSKTGTYCVSFTNWLGDRAYVMEYSVSAANTWEYKTLTVSGGLVTSGNWDWTTQTGLEVGFVLACGSAYAVSPNGWRTVSLYDVAATSNQVNFLDSTSNNFSITGVQLELGAVATPFEHRLFGQEIALCQRYYSKSYGFGVNPATATTAGQLRCVGVANALWWPVDFPAEMRATPTVTGYSPNNGASGVYYDLSTLTNVAITGYQFSTRGGTIYVDTAATTNAWGTVHWVASSEI